MRTVPLHGKIAAGRVALVDDEDYDFVAPYRWRVMETPSTQTRRMVGPYAIANVRRADGAWTSVSMHKLITGWRLTDHVDHNGLNNQRSNLRPATKAQNQQNQRRRSDTASRFKGVHKTERGLGWAAYIKVDGRQRYLGYHSSEELAARAYDAAAINIFGRFALLNFPDGA